MLCKEDISEYIKCSLVQILALFLFDFSRDLVVNLINTMHIHSLRVRVTLWHPLYMLYFPYYMILTFNKRRNICPVKLFIGPTYFLIVMVLKINLFRTYLIHLRPITLLVASSPLLNKNWYFISLHWNISSPCGCSESTPRNTSSRCSEYSLSSLLESDIIVSLIRHICLIFHSTHANPQFPPYITHYVLPTLSNWIASIYTMNLPCIFACYYFFLFGIISHPLRHINGSFLSFLCVYIPPILLWSSNNYLP